jgi:hypothetical protein
VKEIENYLPYFITDISADGQTGLGGLFVFASRGTLFLIISGEETRAYPATTTMKKTRR